LIVNRKETEKWPETSIIQVKVTENRPRKKLGVAPLFSPLKGYFLKKDDKLAGFPQIRPARTCYLSSAMIYLGCKYIERSTKLLTKIRKREDKNISKLIPGANF
jgi:hypothetical protein